MRELLIIIGIILFGNGVIYTLNHLNSSPYQLIIKCKCGGDFREIKKNQYQCDECGKLLNR